jgi:orotidine-5'-phosphate decarboxylase
MELLKNRWKIGRFLSVGLDSDMDVVSTMPLEWQPGQMAREAQFIFNRAIVDATYRWVVAYKPNFWFYASEGEDGFYTLRKTIAYIHEQYPVIPVILDIKGVDIGNTSKKIAKLAFDILRADAVTVHPYLGREGALEPFLERSDKGIFILCKTSNPGAREIQDFARFTVEGGSASNPNGIRYVTEELYLYVARLVQEWNVNGNCGLVAGATHPQAFEHIRTVAPHLPILIPGVGAQGGELEVTVRVARDENNQGFLINASRSVIFASKDVDFSERASEEAQRLHRAIRGILKEEKTNEPEK